MPHRAAAVLPSKGWRKQRSQRRQMGARHRGKRRRATSPASDRRRADLAATSVPASERAQEERLPANSEQRTAAPGALGADDAIRHLHQRQPRCPNGDALRSGAGECGRVLRHEGSRRVRPDQHDHLGDEAITRIRQVRQTGGRSQSPVGSCAQALSATTASRSKQPSSRHARFRVEQQFATIGGLHREPCVCGHTRHRGDAITSPTVMLMHPKCTLTEMSDAPGQGHLLELTRPFAGISSEWS